MNETQRERFGGGEHTPSANLEAGTRALQIGLETTSALSFDAIAATIRTSLEVLTIVGPGNVVVTAETDGFTFEFVGALAGTNLPLMTVVNNSLMQKADTITRTERQSGRADVPVVPSNTTTTPATAQASAGASETTPGDALTQEVQTVTLTGATGGTWTINGGSALAWNATAASVEAEIDSLLGLAVSVVGSDGGPYAVTWTVPGDQPLLDCDGSDLTPHNQHQIDTCTFNDTADGGSMTFDGSSLPSGTNASTLHGSGPTCSGTPASGTITTIWDQDYAGHAPYTVAANTLMVVGQVQIFDVTLDDEPTEGTLNNTLNGSLTGNWTHGAAASTVQAQVSIAGFSVTDIVGGWRFTDTERRADQNDVIEEGNPLRKPVADEVEPVQDGSSSSSSYVPPPVSAASGNLLMMGAG